MSYTSKDEKNGMHILCNMFAVPNANIPYSIKNWQILFQNIYFHYKLPLITETFVAKRKIIRRNIIKKSTHLYIIY